jgi:hypothetical protein
MIGGIVSIGIEPNPSPQIGDLGQKTIGNSINRDTTPIIKNHYL